MKGSMKSLLAPFLLTSLVPFCTFGQGNFWFNNIDNSPDIAPVTVSAAPGTFSPTGGAAGAYIGADYTASLYYLNGTVSDQTLFDSSNPILFASANTLFFGTTRFAPAHGPSSDGAGLFDHGGMVTLPTIGTVTLQVRAWYNGGGLYTSYDQALAAGQNVGEAYPVSLFLALGAGAPPNLDGLLPFTVGVVPEPSVYALLGLGSLLLFRRRKHPVCSRGRCPPPPSPPPPQPPPGTPPTVAACPCSVSVSTQ